MQSVILTDKEEKNHMITSADKEKHMWQNSMLSSLVSLRKVINFQFL